MRAPPRAQASHANLDADQAQGPPCEAQWAHGESNMKLPTDIRFLNVDRSAAVEEAIHERIAKIERQYQELVGWRVTVDLPHRHSPQARGFSVRVDVTLKGHELVVEHVSNDDVYIAVRDAFDAIRRRIEDTVRVQRGDVKNHV